MEDAIHFQCGDVVIHAARPEWGQGTIQDAAKVAHGSQAAQRLTIEFANKGRVVLNTAVARLNPIKRPSTMKSIATTEQTTGGWLGSLQQTSSEPSHELWELPEPLTDPFASSASRLAATLNSFRFSTEPRSLIDWAVAQTGLADPLTKYTRQELEQAFSGFARSRHQHLQNLVRQLKRSGERQIIEEGLQSCRSSEGQAALKMVLRNA